MNFKEAKQYLKGLIPPIELQHTPERFWQQSSPYLGPGVYLIFTDDDILQTVCVKVEDIVAIELNEAGDNWIIYEKSEDPNNPSAYAVLGGVLMIEI